MVRKDMGLYLTANPMTTICLRKPITHDLSWMEKAPFQSNPNDN